MLLLGHGLGLPSSASGAANCQGAHSGSCGCACTREHAQREQGLAGPSRERERCQDKAKRRGNPALVWQACNPTWQQPCTATARAALRR